MEVEIVVFSHLAGRTEELYCEYYAMHSGDINYIEAFRDGKKIAVIPWNRIKQINFR